MGSPPRQAVDPGSVQCFGQFDQPHPRNGKCISIRSRRPRKLPHIFLIATAKGYFTCATVAQWSNAVLCFFVLIEKYWPKSKVSSSIDWFSYTGQWTRHILSPPDWAYGRQSRAYCEAWTRVESNIHTAREEKKDRKKKRKRKKEKEKKTGAGWWWGVKRRRKDCVWWIHGLWPSWWMRTGKYMTLDFSLVSLQTPLISSSSWLFHALDHVADV